MVSSRGSETTRDFSTSADRSVSRRPSSSARRPRRPPPGRQMEAAGEDGSRSRSARSSAARSAALQSSVARSVLCLGSVERTFAREVEVGLEPGRDLRRGEDPDAGRRELQRERNAVELAADASHRRRVVAGEPESGQGGRGALDEELHRGRGGVRGCRGAAPDGDGQGRDRPGGLPGQAERLAAGGEHRERRGRAEEIRDQAGARLDQVLAVVEDQQVGAPGHRARRRPSAAERPGSSRAPKAAATSWETRPGSWIDSRPTQTTARSVRREISAARRVLPTPPGPVRVRSRVDPRSRTTLSISRARPTRRVTGAGGLADLSGLGGSDSACWMILVSSSTSDGEGSSPSSDDSTRR